MKTGLEYAMRSRAIMGLYAISVTASVALAHAPGVSHSYEDGQPVITVRLVPDEVTAAKAKRIDTLAPAPEHTNPSDEAGVAGVQAQETLEPAASEDFGAPLNAEPTNELPSAANAPGLGAEAVVSRYPSVRPALKPNTETGVGGVLDLAPPIAAEPAQPRPMRLNSVQRPRTVTERAPRQTREQKPVPQRARKDVLVPSAPDPLDEALPSRVIDAPTVNAMQLPPPKADERLSDGN